jgi:exodeoxyribonuclease VII small subunit
VARRKSTTEEGNLAAPPAFEEALAGLEKIVEAMEHEHLSLEDLVAHYEKGSALLTHCESVLQSARSRIELITLRNQNEITLDAGDETADGKSLSSDLEDDDDDDNDIRLF